MTAQPSRVRPGHRILRGDSPGRPGRGVVPVADFLRLRALEQAASPQDLEDAEDTAAVLEWRARDAAGETTLVPADDDACPRG
jgi:hypothetical protein